MSWKINKKCSIIYYWIALPAIPFVLTVMQLMWMFFHIMTSFICLTRTPIQLRLGETRKEWDEIHKGGKEMGVMHTVWYDGRMKTRQGQVTFCFPFTSISLDSLYLKMKNLKMEKEKRKKKSSWAKECPGEPILGSPVPRGVFLPSSAWGSTISSQDKR